jgi:hypothetical protein
LYAFFVLLGLCPNTKKPAFSRFDQKRAILVNGAFRVKDRLSADPCLFEPKVPKVDFQPSSILQSIEARL